LVLAFAFLRYAFTFDHIISMGFTSLRLAQAGLGCIVADTVQLPLLQ
jgi:hypothetical protein